MDAFRLRRWRWMLKFSAQIVAADSRAEICSAPDGRKKRNRIKGVYRMNETSGDSVDEREFELALKNLIDERPMKIWLAKSSGQRLDTLASVGHAVPMPIQMFDHIEGFYLLGEGVPPDLLTPIHELFARYCRSHRDSAHRNPQHRVEVQYRSFEPEYPHIPNRLIMHYPFSASIPLKDRSDG